jgi:dolichol-phosphate mannosyltransferase
MSSHDSVEVMPGAAGVMAALQSRAQSKVFVVLPSYNEGPNLGPLFAGIDATMGDARLPYEVVLVDDGSSDTTASVLAESRPKYPLTVVQHQQNSGLAVTMRDGLLEALRRAEDTDVIVTMDADGTHIPTVILEMMRLIDGGCDVVVASRFRPGATVRGVPAYRQVLSVGASWMCRAVFPTRGIRDFTCGYRAIRASALQQALRKYGDKLFDAEGFACTMDLLLKLRRMKIVFVETPINLRYDLKEGESKMHVTSTIFRTLTMMFRRRMDL